MFTENIKGRLVSGDPVAGRIQVEELVFANEILVGCLVAVQGDNGAVAIPGVTTVGDKIAVFIEVMDGFPIRTVVEHESHFHAYAGSSRQCALIGSLIIEGILGGVHIRNGLFGMIRRGDRRLFLLGLAACQRDKKAKEENIFTHFSLCLKLFTYSADGGGKTSPAFTSDDILTMPSTIYFEYPRQGKEPKYSL